MSSTNFTGTDPMDMRYTNSGINIDLTRNDVPINPTSSLESLNNTPSVENINAVNEFNQSNLTEFDPTTIIPKKQKDPGTNEVFANLDIAVEREKENITQRMQALEEKMYEDYIDSQDNIETEEVTVSTSEEIVSDSDDFYTGTNEVETEEDKSYNVYKSSNEDDIIETKSSKVEEKPVTIEKTVSDEILYDEDEMEEDLDVDENEAKARKREEEQEKELNETIDGLKEAAKDVIKPYNTIDLSKFTIGKHGVKASTIILKEEKNSDVADWVMYESGLPISMSALTGPELIKLDPDNSTRNRLNTMKDIYKIIYDHVVDSKKVSFDRWLKQTKYSDIDHIYFALYKATFNGSNFVSYQCPDCKKVFIKDMPFSEMVKMKDDSVKTKVDDILAKSTDNGEIKFNVDLVQVSNKYVFGMRSPSLYNIIMETAGLPDNILEKYSDLIDTITYIDSIYTIDYTNMQLIPVIIPVVKDDPVKSTIKKIKTMYTLLKELSSDEYYTLRGYINKVSTESDELTYRVPGAKCPECDKEIPSNENTSASALLFTRHHLGAFANM